MKVSTDPRTVALADIPALRAELVAEAEAMTTRAEGGELLGADATDFRTLQQMLGVLEYRERSAELDGGLGKFLGAIPDGDGNGKEAGPASPRVMGGISPLVFADDTIRQLHDDFMSNRHAQVSVETRDVTAPAMATISDYRLPPLTKLRERQRIAALLPAQGTTSVSVTYYTTSTGATAAAPVAEAAAKPESTPGFTPVVATIRKLAHFVDVSKEALDDYANFEQVVRDEMIAGLINTENDQLLNGDGTGINLTGLLAASGILTYAPGSAEARYISVRHAIRVLQAAFIDPDTIVLNPADAELFDLSNAATAGIHAAPDASGGVRQEPARSAWGLRVVVDTMIASGTALVGNLSAAAVVFQREAPSIFVDPYSQSANNLVRFIAEERLALGVVRPTALLRLTFNGTA